MAIKETNFQFSDNQSVYHGKVRDVYEVDGQFVVVATDRISAFDHILPKPIPHKGQVLNQVATHFLKATEDIVPNWLTASPDPNVSVGLKCEPVKVEMVIRGYLAGHAWRLYRAGERMICGVSMPDGMVESQAFPDPIITPATKADEGHDEDISREEIIAQGIVPEEMYLKMEAYTRALFARGQEMAAERDLILVDTKYEFGIHDGEIYLIDEIHTPDSSRYFYASEYEERLAKGKPQEQLSKEFVREWLMTNGFQGKDDQDMPIMPDEFVQTVSDRYISLYEIVTGVPFIKESESNILERIETNVKEYLKSIKK